MKGLNYFGKQKKCDSPEQNRGLDLGRYIIDGSLRKTSIFGHLGEDNDQE
jgi:hypothetical protein